jgi:hypothetical protein
MAHLTMLNRAKGVKLPENKEEGVGFVCSTCKKEYKTKGRYEKHLTKHE